MLREKEPLRRGLARDVRSQLCAFAATAIMELSSWLDFGMKLASGEF